MVESLCRRFIIVVEHSKLADHIRVLGLTMPVDVIPFRWSFIVERLRHLFAPTDCVKRLRTAEDSGESTEMKT